VLNKLLPFTILAALAAAALPAQGVKARFTTDKADYLAGEPIFVNLTVSNDGDGPVWIDFKFKSTDPSKIFCDDFAVEVPGAESAGEQWGCGSGGSCGHSLSEVLPSKTLSVRQLLNWRFRLEPGVYAIRARAEIVVHAENLFDSPQIAQFDDFDTLIVKVQTASENELQAVYKPIVAELDSPDLLRQREAAESILTLAAPFLEDTLIELTKTMYAANALPALRKANTPKTRNFLAQIAIGNHDPALQIEAIQNLGRTGDMTYLPDLLRLMQSDDKEIRSAATEAVGNLGGADSVQQLAALVSSPDKETRLAGIKGLGAAHASQAVPFLIELLLNPDPNVREAAVSALYLLTHLVALDGKQWADVKSPQSAAAVHRRWVRSWKSVRETRMIHGMADCGPPESLD
jgi:hypothetical protein